MIGDPAAGDPGGEQAVGVLPDLKPVLVAADQDVEDLVRSARADIARLSLELRAALHDAATAEEIAAGLDPEPDDVDLGAARELLRTTLQPRVERRRAELAGEVEQARLEAARHVLAAQTEAAALVAEAREEMVQTLLAGTQPASEPEPEPVAQTEPEPEPEPEPVAQTVADAVVRAVERALAEAQEVRPVETGAPSDTAGVGLGPHASEEAGVGAPAGAPKAPETQLVPAVAPVPAAQVVEGEEGGWSWARFLYADVLLPMIAAIVVIVVLLAWLG